MSRTLTLVLVTLALTSIVAQADIINKNGGVSISISGIVSRGSHLIQFNGIKASPGHALGSVSFTTGALMSGSLLNGGAFSSEGSSFTVTGKNKDVPRGVIFTGSFLGRIQWILMSRNGPNLVYLLTGRVEGQLYNGRFIVVRTNQTITTNVGQLAKGIGHIKIGKTPFTLNSPEPATYELAALGLLLTAAATKIHKMAT